VANTLGKFLQVYSESDPRFVAPCENCLLNVNLHPRHVSRIFAVEEGVNIIRRIDSSGSRLSTLPSWLSTCRQAERIPRRGYSFPFLTPFVGSFPHSETNRLVVNQFEEAPRTYPRVLIALTVSL
jgi:hypothetical protein